MTVLPSSVLVPSARMPRSLPIVRALGEAGVRVYTLDTTENVQMAPTSHSRYIRGALTARAPSADPLGYADDVGDLVREHGIESVLPHFEEIFYLAAHRDRIDAPLFAAPFPTLRELHDKSRFVTLCSNLGIATPATHIVHSQAELAAAASEVSPMLAKPAFSRGGMVVLTDTGPRAGERTVQDCHPGPDDPWLVQEFVTGIDICWFGVAREGQVVLSCPYRPTIEGPGGFGIQFESVPDFGALEIAQTIARHTSLTGFFGLDFRQRADGSLAVLECNARATNGVYLVPHQKVLEAVYGEPAGVFRASPGHRAQWDIALVMPQISHLSVPQTLHELLTVTDPYVDRHDMLPFLEYLAGLRQYIGRNDSEEEMAQAMLGDLAWDGADLQHVGAEQASR